MAKKIYTEEEARQRKNARQREYMKRVGYEKGAQYNKERGKSISFRVFTPQDDDILAFLDTLPNKAGYFKELIRKDMAERKKAEPVRNGNA